MQRRSPLPVPLAAASAPCRAVCSEAESPSTLSPPTRRKSRRDTLSTARFAVPTEIVIEAPQRVILPQNRGGLHVVNAINLPVRRGVGKDVQPSAARVYSTGSCHYRSTIS